MGRRSVLAAIGAAPFAARADGILPVVASFSILADLTRQVGGEAVSVEVSVGPCGDVHMYEASSLSDSGF